MRRSLVILFNLHLLNKKNDKSHWQHLKSTQRYLLLYQPHRSRNTGIMDDTHRINAWLQIL